MGIHGRGGADAGHPLPLETEFSWGLIRIVDRLKVSNEYLAFGGRSLAAAIDDAVIGVFTSAAPILRRGGHSQGWDHGAACVGAFFARVLLAIDYSPRVRGALLGRRARRPLCGLRLRPRRSISAQYDPPGRRPALWNVLEAEERRLRADDHEAWEHGIGLAHEISPEELPAAS